MNGRIQLLAVGDGVPLELLDALAADLAKAFRVSCHVREDVVDPRFALDMGRGQVHSTAILAVLEKLAAPGTRVLGVTATDLYVPVLTFVFGEAQMPGVAALVSLCRLHEEFYGLGARPEVLRERLFKSALHELGHTFGLRHCGDWRCVMASAHAVERLDIKEASYCASCRRRLAGD